MDRETLVENLSAGDRTRGASGEGLSRAFLRSVVDFAARYAKLEKMVLGGTRVMYSNVPLELNLSLEGDVIAQGEELAEGERARFDLPEGPILELAHLVEDQGVKIIPWVFPEGSPARSGFFFDSELGPCILLDAKGSKAEMDYALAHQFGHFLADYDPYIMTICGRPDPETLADPRELRAHQFALAYLMPRADLELYRDAMGLIPGTPIPMEFVQQLQVYFDVDFEIVFWRLLSLGWIDPQQIKTLLEANAGILEELSPSAARPNASDLLVPERFIHLVASAFGRKLIQVEQAAELLGTDVEETAHILGQFKYGDQERSSKVTTAIPGTPPPASTPSPN